MHVQVPTEVFDFFKKLEKNNNRDWFNDHKTEFKAIETNVKAVYNAVFESLKTVSYTHLDVYKRQGVSRYAFPSSTYPKTYSADKRRSSLFLIPITFPFLFLST